MKLWKISQSVNRNYDTFYAAVVVAETSDEARHISPSEHVVWQEGLGWRDEWGDLENDAWALPSDVEAVEVGEAAPGLTSGTIIVAAFHAG